MDLDFWVGICKFFAFIIFIYWGFSYFQMKKDYDKLLRVVANLLKEKMNDRWWVRNGYARRRHGIAT